MFFIDLAGYKSNSALSHSEQAAMASQDTAPLKDSYNDAPPAYSPPMNQQQQGYGAASPQNYPPNSGYAPGES